MAMQPLRLVKFEALYEVLINEICGIMKINFKRDGSSVYGGLSGVLRFYAQRSIQGVEKLV